MIFYLSVTTLVETKVPSIVRGFGVMDIDGQVPSELHSIRKLKEYETIQEPNQLTTVTRLPAKPLTLMGNI